MKRKDSNWVGILSDQGEAATASNLSEYTTSFYLKIWIQVDKPFQMSEKEELFGDPNVFLVTWVSTE